jgi:hypothetical protein
LIAVPNLQIEISVTPPTDDAAGDMAFASSNCKMFLLTASASTFGFWSAYLSEAKDIFYNCEAFKKGNRWVEENAAIFAHHKIIFPPEWRCLILSKNEGSVAILGK